MSVSESLTDQDLIAADPSVWVEVDGQMVPDYGSTMSDFSEGDVVSGLVVRIDKDEILVDIGYKSEGVIPVSELSIRRSVNPEDEVQLGEEVDALVMQKEDADGRLILSKKRARFEKAWKRIEAAAESGEPVDGHVIEVVKGGLIIDLGVRGFLPASLVDIRRVHDLEEFRGQELRCKVIELNRSRNNVVLSRRAVLEEERREVRQRILDDLEPGKVVEGVISNIVDFGAFVDLDGIDGLIHISELSWSHVNHPSEILEIGQRVRVKVLDIDRERQRISLGLKQTQADPWQRVLESYGQDDVVWGRVTKVVTFGAFVEILQGVEGLVHISELAAHHVENPREVVSQGDIVKAKIIDIDAERRRLSLSMKRVLEDEDAQPPIALVPGDAPFLTPPSGDEPGRAEPYTGSTELTEEEEQAQAHELGLSADVFSDEARGAGDVELDEPEPALAAAEDDDVLKLSTELNNEIEDVDTVYVAEAVEVEPEAEVAEEADTADEPVAEVTEDEPVAEVTEDDPIVLEAEAEADAEDEAQVETEAEAHADDDDAAERA
jgi:small subunit ribosomal protein S1